MSTVAPVGYSYLGCFTALPTTALLIAGLDPQSCSQYCFDKPSGPYGIFSVTGVQDDNSRAFYCWCSTDPPDSTTYISAGSPDDCTPEGRTTISSYQYFVQSTFEEANGVCYGGTDTLGSYIPVDSPEKCYQQCEGSVYASFLPTSPGYRCACGTTLSDVVATSSSITCGSETFYTYSHQAATRSDVRGADTSYYVKRRLRERLEEERNRKVAHCPWGRTACTVPGGGADAFECIDTETELESCGGCAYGVFGQNETVAINHAVDCSSLPGVARGSVTCTSGRCEAFACKRGYTLLGGDCVPVGISGGWFLGLS